jgi:hypothetical protein
MGKVAEIHADMESLGIGHNQPPETIEAAQDTMRSLSDWMAEHPIIEIEDDAREAKKLLDRAKGCAGEIENDRDRQVRPLNDQIANINGKYKAVHNADPKKPGTLDRIVTELKARLAIFIRAEEVKRQAEADRLRLAAEAAARIAREAEAKEREAIQNAQAGELGVDVTQVVIEADSRFADFQKADREAARAERNEHVKIGGGWGNAVSLRTKETLVLVSYGKAITAIGPNDKIRDAILSAAREYRKERGALPEGVISETTKEL